MHSGSESNCAPVFVVGTPRSGTTLLYSLLMASGAFPVYEAESRILECSTRYGNLRRERNFRRFAADFQNSRQFARSGMNAEEFFRQVQGQCGSYTDFLRHFMGRIALAQGKRRWAEKTPNHVLYVSELARAFPAAKFLHAVRDGRDVALSQRAVKMTARYSRNPVAQLVWGGKVWEGLVRLGRRQQQLIPDRVLEIHYESVITDLDQVVGQLNDFLDLEISREKITAARVGSLGNANTVMAIERGSGVTAGALERWRTQLDRREIRALDRAIGDTLKLFGYPVETPPGSLPGGTVLFHATVAPAALKCKRWLNRHTPLGRVAQKPLEIGLT